MVKKLIFQAVASLFLMGLLTPPSDLRGQDPHGLRLGPTLELARERSPRLRAVREMVKAVQSQEPGAGLLPDPMLQVGVANLAIPEFSASMPASMAPTFQAQQRFPLAGKLSLRSEMAEQTTGIARAQADESWWEVRTEVASAFYQIYQMDEQIEVMRETLGLLEDFQAVARSMYESGTGRQADVLRANVEIARMAAEIERMSSMRTAYGSRLNALLDRPAETPVPGPSLDPLPASVPDQETLRGWALSTRPALAGLQWEVARAGTGRSLADKAIWPDLTVGLQYGFGRMAGDLKGMGGASVGFSIPLYAGKRQFKARDEAAAMEAVAEARYAQMLALVDSRIGEGLADLTQARTLIGLYQQEILPQARATVESSFSSYRVGSVDFMTLLDAQMALNRFQGEYYGLLASYGTAVVRLEMTIGRDLPVTDELHLEES
jgi:cobalt-zinc-cadmium efflux system outer membrane protein